MFVDDSALLEPSRRTDVGFRPTLPSPSSLLSGHVLYERPLRQSYPPLDDIGLPLSPGSKVYTQCLFIYLLTQLSGHYNSRLSEYVLII